MKDRISKILRLEGMTAAKLADEIGVQASGISHILSGRNNPSTDFLIKILDRFRGINAEWLLTGKGNMYKGMLDIPLENPEDTDKKSVSGDSAGVSNDNLSTPSSENLLKIEQNEEISAVTNANSSKQTETIKIENNQQQPLASANYEKPENDRKVVKIVMFFNDDTFESYNPHK